MALTELTATPDPAGHRIVLTWRGSGLPGLRVVRRSGAFPATAEDGVVVADSDGAGTVSGEPIEDGGEGRLRLTDSGLAEGVHYYQLFPYQGAPAVYQDDPANRISAAAGAPYGFADRLASLLPAVYHRFDVLTPDAAADPAIAAATGPDHAAQGQLRRFLELPGAELDRLYGDIRALLDLSDVHRVEGRLLPLLAATIGWPTDHRLGFDEQRTEIDHAPALYRTVGTVPGVEAAVRRFSGWPVATKEFVDNIATSNRPERRTLWLARPAGAGWEVDSEPLSLDSSPHGRPSLVSGGPDGGAGSLAVVYHSASDSRHEIRWKLRTGGIWRPSRAIISRDQVDRDPAAARQGATVWFFWSVYQPGTATWRIDLRPLGPEGLGPVTVFGAGEVSPPQRRSPAAAVDPQGALWLFWLERSAAPPAGGWRIRQARFTGTPWNPTPQDGFDVPDDLPSRLRPEGGLSVVVRAPRTTDPVPAFRRIGVFWTRREPVAGTPGQDRSVVVARFKNGSNPSNQGDWTPVAQVPSVAPRDQDRDPAAQIAPDGGVRLLFSSTRDGGWSLYGSSLRLDPDPIAWSPPEPLTGPPFSEGAPLPLSLAGTGALDAIVLRSNRSITRTSAAHAATVTVDRRWSGTTTVRRGDSSVERSRHGTFDDHLTYTYDTGRTEADRYSRDTIGLFVETDGAGPDQVTQTRERLRRVLPEFLPATDRAVVIDPLAE